MASKAKESHSSDPEIGPLVALLTYISYAILIGVGYVRDFAANVTGVSRYEASKTKKGYSILLKSWENFFTRRLYHRIQDCWNRPICSSPSRYIDVMCRETKDGNKSLQLTGESKHCLNLGSYNYLGFADNWLETCAPTVLPIVDTWPISMCSPRAEMGYCSMLEELEEVVANFVGKEAAIVYTMGYGTNTATLPALLGPGSLIVSDALNHTSLVNGARATGAQIRIFHHNDPAHLEEILREAVIQGQPKHHRPWKKILVVVEGIYSMEGAICKLPAILKVVKKYKAYIYVDEAHSIGALGKTGRGVCEYYGIDPAEIDVLMGTFTKSFGGMGGYIAGDRALINRIKAESAGVLYHNAMSPVICQQIRTALAIIGNTDPNGLGQQKLQALRDNSNYFRSELLRLGLHIYGDNDSPIVPMLVYMPAKISAFSRECLDRGVAVVVVGFPATSVILSRARFCISAGHTREDLEYAVAVIEEVADLLCLRYNSNMLGCGAL